MEQTASPRPKNWLTESILVTLFCCIPLGIIGILNASKVNSAFDSGDIDGAVQASADARKWTRLAFILGLVVYIASGIMVLFMWENLMEGTVQDAQNMESVN